MRAWLGAALLSTSVLGGACLAEPDAPGGSVQVLAPGDADARPEGPYAIAVGATLPDLAFEGIEASGQRARLHLHDHAARQGGPAQLLVIQVSGGLWCGTCRSTAEHLDDILARAANGRGDRLDLVLRDRDNAPADADHDALAWREAVGGAAPTAVDPSFTFLPALEGVAAPLPLLLLVDARTMVLEDVLSNPDPHALAARVAGRLAALDGLQPPAVQPEPLVRDLFHDNEWQMLLEMAATPAAPPPDPTNRVADSPAAAALGEALFFDTGLSPSAAVACSTCHRPELGFSDGAPIAEGVAQGSRRTPSIELASHGRWQGWDGRADSLWAQALGPLENPAEMGSSRTFIARRVLDHHQDAYRAAFGDAPTAQWASWPLQGGPGDPPYDALDDEDQQAITSVFVAAGKAIAAYQRTLRAEPTALDRWVDGDGMAMTDDQVFGLLLFFRAGCAQCHWGPRLTDDAFHDTGVGLAPHDAGRSRGVVRWRASEFRADGPWSDALVTHAVADAPQTTRRQFKTPGLRGVGAAAFFGHAGTQHDLAGVTEAYGRPGEREPWLPTFTETAQWGLVPFLDTL